MEETTIVQNPSFSEENIYVPFDLFKSIYNIQEKKKETVLEKIKNNIPEQFIARSLFNKRKEETLTIAYERVHGYSPIVSIEEVTNDPNYIYASFYKKYINTFYLSYYKCIIEDNYTKKYKLSVNEFMDILKSMKA